MTAPVFTFGLQQSDLENALNVATVLALFDDGDGVINQTALAAVLQNGELEFASWLVGQYGTPLPGDLASDPFFRRCAIEFACGYAIERHPEFAKQQGFATATAYFERATKRAERVTAARQRPTTVAEEPANVGGPVTVGLPRMYIPNPPGILGDGYSGRGGSNAGDF